MKKKIVKLGIIAVLTFALILSSFGALPFGDTLAKEFDIGAKNQTTAQAAETPWDGTTATYTWYTSPSTPNNFKIATASDLKGFSNLVNGTYTNVNGKSEVAISFVDKRIVLTADIVLNETINGSSKVWVPIGYVLGTPFLGTFDGQGHTVSGVYITSGDYLGLFGVVGSYDIKKSIVKNVGVIDSSINGGQYVGGVIGWNYGKVTNCYNNGVVTGTSDVGGVIGHAPDGIVTNCYNLGAVSGAKNVGGVVGQNEANGSVVNCYNTGAVTATTSDVGGVIGINASKNKVTNCYNRGEVSGTSTNIGGVVGQNFKDATTTNSYFLKTTGTNETLNAAGTATTTTSCGYFTDNGETLTAEAGSIIGNNKKLLDALNAGVPEYNKTDPGKAIPAMAWAADTEPGGYPKHTTGGVTPPPEPTKPFEKGEGTATAPFEISNAQDLIKLSELINAADAKYSAEGVHYKLTADIKLNGDKTITSESTDATPWNSIGESGAIPFFGVFDGDGHTVSGIYIKNNDQFQGLFGVVGSDTVKTATIKNVGVINSYIEGNGNTGGIVGANNGAIINCYNLGAVTAKGDNVGGVVGGNIGKVINCYNRGDVQQVNESDNNCGGVVGLNVGSVDNCYNLGAVTAKGDNVGGVVGCNIGSVINCYNRGAVKGTTSNVGGVVGGNSGTVDNCYNTGAVAGTTTNIGGVVGFNNGTVTNSYFLKIAGTNKDLNAVGTGTPTATCGTFTDNVGTLAAETGSSIIDSKTILLDALNAGAAAYNATESGAETPAMTWIKGTDGYPKHTTVVTPPTPPAGGGDSDSEPSISPEDIFWTRIITDLKHKDEPVVEFNCKYPRMSRSVLLALQEVEKTLNINLNGEKLAITSKQVKPLTFDKASYSVAELKALLEVKPEITPTPTPTPTEKPTEPVVPETPTANLTWLWILLAVVAVGAVVAFVVIKRKKK